MKKIVFGSAAALLAVIGFSSFKNSKTFQTSYYWFGVPSGKDISLSNENVTLAQIGGEATYQGFEQQADVSFPCPAGAHLCLIGYTLGSISGFTTGGTPTGFKTLSSSPGTPKPWTTRGATSRDN